MTARARIDHTRTWSTMTDGAVTLARMTFDEFMEQAEVAYENLKTPYGPNKNHDAFRQAMEKAWRDGKSAHDAVREYLNSG